MPKANTVPNYYIIDEEGDVTRTEDEATAKYYAETSVVIDVKANTVLGSDEQIDQAPEIDEGDDDDAVEADEAEED